MNTVPNTLADRVERDILTAARQRNPGVNPASISLTDSERITCDAIERYVAEQFKKLPAGCLTQGEVRRLRRMAADGE